VYAALRIAQAIKSRQPSVVTVLGGGFVNTELRELSEPRLFDHIDYVTLDAGERPLLALLDHLAGRRSASRLVRTYRRTAEGQVRYENGMNPTSRLPTSARPPGTACRCSSTCRCWTC
jgi:hypothetical protein